MTAILFNELNSAMSVPVTGFEPVRSFDRKILSLLCLPFHHTGLATTDLDSSVLLILPYSKLLPVFLPCIVQFYALTHHLFLNLLIPT